MRLHDRVFLLLGGTGGIGKALLDALVQVGSHVIVASRRLQIWTNSWCA